MTTSRAISSIEKLIPQRSPIMMVDELLRVDGYECTCRLTVRDDIFFIEEDGRMAEPGVIEHIAQSASAFAGYMAIAEGAVEPPVGYIGEVRNFRLFNRPRIGDVLTTVISMGPTVAGVTIINGVVSVGDEKIAETQMKIFVPED
ncbi:MAG: beta-hydroxyacyl-ACP dehydratase [Bacteroidaceae bacterium]|nr:beta-hydroxyacyl-ACP dehydratase [Bacteroidaceae bacterium]